MSYTIDLGHSLVSFTVRHMMLTKTRGEFHAFSGTVNLNEQTPELSTVDISVDTASISTRDANRDGHLKSPDFFNVAEYPAMTFKSSKVERTGDNTAKLHGDLTIRDVTKPVVLDVEYAGNTKSPWGATAYGFNASTKINREEWGLTWNVGLEAGGFLVGKDVQIDIELELVKVEQPVAVAVA